MVLEGTITRAGVVVPIVMSSPFDTLIVSRDNFDFLSSVLAKGLSTGPPSAVWGVTGTPPGGALIFQLGGVRRAGGALPVLGAFFPGIPPGRGPALPGQIPDGLRILFATDDYRATGATGSLLVEQPAPLRGHLLLQLVDDLGLGVTLDGELAVSLTGVGCT